MATNTVGSTGDYATLSAWEAAVQGTSDATEIAQLQSEDHANDAAADISGWTNTPDVTIGAVDAQDGDFSTGARFTRSSGGFIVVCSESDVPVTVEDVAVTITGGFYIGLITGTDGATYSNGLRFGLSRCMVKSNDNFGCSGATLNVRSTTISAGNRIGLDIDNCVFADFTSSSNALEFGYSGAGRQNIDVVIRGTTFYESKITIGSSHGDSTSAITARGCLWKTPSGADALVDNTSGTGTYSFTSSRCILDESSATHTADWTTSTNNSYSVTFNDSGAPASGEVSFTDAVNDDYSIVDDSNNLAIDFVTSGSMPSTDILGETRDSNPDAGAFEIIASGVTGTAAMTFGALEMSASGTVGAEVAGTAAMTFGALEQASSGTAAHVGTAAMTFGALTQASSGTAAHVGTAAMTFGALEQASSGTVQLQIEGTAAMTFGALEQAAAGDVATTGAAAMTFGAFTQAAAGIASTAITGTAAMSFAALDMSAEGAGEGVSRGAFTFPALGMDARGGKNLAFLAAKTVGQASGKNKNPQSLDSGDT